MLRPPGKTYLGFVSLSQLVLHATYTYFVQLVQHRQLQWISYLQWHLEQITFSVVYYWHSLIITSRNSAAFAFGSNDLAVKHRYSFSVYFQNLIFFLSNCNSPRFMRWQCVRPTKSRCYITDRCTPYNRMADKSTLLQVMTLCRQATNRCLSQRRPRPMSPYGVTMLQWVDIYVCISNVFLLLSIYGIFIRASFSGSIIN